LEADRSITDISFAGQSGRRIKQIPGIEMSYCGSGNGEILQSKRHEKKGPVFFFRFFLSVYFGQYSLFVIMLISLDRRPKMYHVQKKLEEISQ
jgi:hypothetical protein